MIILYPLQRICYESGRFGSGQKERERERERIYLFCLEDRSQGIRYDLGEIELYFFFNFYDSTSN